MPSFSRRDFLATSAAAAAAIALSKGAFAARRHADEPDELDDTNVKPADKKLNILILGGTSFTGPHLVRLALKRGHSVTVFNRGRTEKRIGMLPDSVERLVGDRDPSKGEGIKALQGTQTWDAVVDTSGQFPRHIRASCEALKDRVKTYIYVSSISAYATPIAADANEDAPLATLKDPNTEDMGPNFENYGGLKAACERTCEEVLPKRVAVVRPTYIVGPGDPTDRFTYWPWRINKGGEVAVPGTTADRIRFIDTRDLAAFYLTLCENATTGVFNACGPSAGYTMGQLANACRKASGSDATFTYMDEDFVVQQPGIGFPIWVPQKSEHGGMGSINFDRSIKAGMKLRSADATVKDTLAWFPKEIQRRERVTKEIVEEATKSGKPAPNMPDPQALRAGLTLDQEKKLLAAWEAHTKAKG